MYLFTARLVPLDTCSALSANPGWPERKELGGSCTCRSLLLTRSYNERSLSFSWLSLRASLMSSQTDMHSARSLWLHHFQPASNSTVSQKWLSLVWNAVGKLVREKNAPARPSNPVVRCVSGTNTLPLLAFVFSIADPAALQAFSWR